MTMLGRRGFMSVLATLPGVRWLSAATDVVEAEEASAFFAPYLTDVLVPGATLSVEQRPGGSYVLFRGLLVGRMPDEVQWRTTRHRVRVAQVTHDANGRMKLFVECRPPAAYR